MPRDVSGERLIRHLCKYWDYRQANQVGSHVVLTTERPRHHRIPIPLHDPLGIGIFKRILNEVCQAKDISQPDFLANL
jgi:predicted RNA binding protein YcfA (HicA-like mRNA interferase family)